jgi:hypothetical protein
VYVSQSSVEVILYGSSNVIFFVEVLVTRTGG